VFLNNPLQNGRRAGVVPDPLGINHSNGTLLADPEAVRLGSINASVGFREAKFLQALLEVVPGFQPLLF
jgi:hypothetical protein